MQLTTVPPSTTNTGSVLSWAARRENQSPVSTRRDAANRRNAQHSTGPRTASGKKRSSLNALRHGLTATTAVLPSEDPAAFEQHCRKFHDEYQPANATEAQLVKDLADTSWRLNRIPLLEADLLARASGPPSEQAAIEFDIVDALQGISTLGLHSARLSRQFQKALDQLRSIQQERREHERFELRKAAELLVHHQHKGLPWSPSDDGFVFSKEQVEQFAQRAMRQNESRHIGGLRFNVPPQIAREIAPWAF